jgi:hypothetical protein
VDSAMFSIVTLSALSALLVALPGTLMPGES